MAGFSAQGLLRMISQGVSWAVFFLEALGKNPLPSSFWLLAWLSSCGCNGILVSLLVVSRKPLSGLISSPHSLPLSSSVFKASSGESPSLPPLSPSDASNLLHQAFLWAPVIVTPTEDHLPYVKVSWFGTRLLWSPFTAALRLVSECLEEGVCALKGGNLGGHLRILCATTLGYSLRVGLICHPPNSIQMCLFLPSPFFFWVVWSFSYYL